MLKKFGGPWLMGDDYTLADMAVLPLIDRMQDLGLDDLWIKPYPTISKWLHNAQKRLASRQSYVQGSRLSEQFPDIVRGLGSLWAWLDNYFKDRRDKL